MNQSHWQPLLGNGHILVATWRLVAENRFSVAIAVVVAMMITAATARAAQFIPLASPTGQTNTFAVGISDDGSVIAGHFQGLATPPATAFRWTESTGTVFLGTLPGHTHSYAGLHGGETISGDGSTIVGNSEKRDGTTGELIEQEAFVYTMDGGLRGIGRLIPSGDSVATCVSFDGRIVAGLATNASGQSEAFRWTEANGMVGLGHLFGASFSQPSDMSADGSKIVGASGAGNQVQAVLWQAGKPVQPLGVNGAATAISADGKFIAGEGYVSSASRTEAFRWDEQTGVVGLGWLPGATESFVRSINGDGSIIVGWGYTSSVDDARAFIWTADRGMQDLQQLLIDQYGLEADLAGWKLWAPQAVSLTGQFIAGVGINPSGGQQAWLVRLDAAVPEPPSVLLVLSTLLIAPSRRREVA